MVRFVNNSQKIRNVGIESRRTGHILSAFKILQMLIAELTLPKENQLGLYSKLRFKKQNCVTLPTTEAELVAENVMLVKVFD